MTTYLSRIQKTFENIYSPLPSEKVFKQLF